MNPLMQAMTGGRMNQAMDMLRMLKGGNPEQIARHMMQNNPQFKAFIEANQGKDPMQVARENGIDLSKFKGMI